MNTHLNTISDLERDDLTGLYTRKAFMQYASEAFLQNTETNYVLVISDVADFKHIISFYGEKESDEVMRENARLVSSVMPAEAIIGRYNIDQIACLVPVQDDDYEKRSDVHPISSFTTTGGTKATLKMGACKCVDRSLSLKIYVEHAMAALESIKHQYGRDFAFVDEALLNSIQRRALIEQNMEQALREEQFSVYYQPKHDVVTGKLVSAEALVRWTHPELGFLPPSEFIPVFEQTGFIAELDGFVWRKACQDLRKWMDAGLQIIPISINSSRIELARDDQFFERRIKAAKEYGIPAELLHIEVTESMFGDSMESVAEVLKTCKAFGFGIELDDFGSGYSSMHTLGDLPLDTVKLDMSLVKNIEDPKTFRVTSACISMIKNMDLEIVAEGVETEFQRDRLKELEVDTIQGYFYSKPLPEKAFEDYLDNNPIFSIEEKKNRAAIKKLMDIPMIDWDSRRYLISHLMTALFKMWGSLFIVDIRTGKSEELLGDQYFRDNITESKMSDEIAQTYIEKSLVPKYKEAYLEFYDFSTLEKRFEGHKSLTFEFEDYYSGWMRSSMFPAGIDADGHLSHVLMTVERINTEKMNERRLANNK